MQAALLLFFILVVTRLRVALDQSDHIYETGQFDLNAIHTLSQPPHSRPNGVGLNSIGRGQRRLGLAQ